MDDAWIEQFEAAYALALDVACGEVDQAPPDGEYPVVAHAQAADTHFVDAPGSAQPLLPMTQTPAPPAAGGAASAASGSVADLEDGHHILRTGQALAELHATDSPIHSQPAATRAKHGSEKQAWSLHLDGHSRTPK